MIELHEFCDVARTPEESFDYVSDFTTTVEWDATARQADKLTPEPIGIGTVFQVKCATPVGSIMLQYEVTEYAPGERLVLSGSCRFFDICDTITFQPSTRGCRIDYRAKFDFKEPLTRISPRFQKGLEKMGRDSVAGLGLALEDSFPLQQPSRLTRMADRLVLPGISMFTRMGYSLGRKKFKPMTASIKGKHIVITGATNGLGLATARDLARRGATLTLVARDSEKAQKLVSSLRDKTGNPDIRFELADLSLLAEVDALAERLLSSGQAIDVLINNAGALFNDRGNTIEGIERSHALLLLSPYRLTNALKPLLELSDCARVINVVSGGMYSQKLNVGRLKDSSDREYSGSVAYARQKRALMVLTREWAKDWKDDGIVVNAMHPGWADTPGVQNALPGFRRLTHKVLRSPEEGADTIIWMAVASEAGDVSGKLFLDRETRTEYLLRRTREQQGEVSALMEYLAAVS